MYIHTHTHTHTQFLKRQNAEHIVARSATCATHHAYMHNISGLHHMYAWLQSDVQKAHAVVCIYFLLQQHHRYENDPLHTFDERGIPFFPLHFLFRHSCAGVYASQFSRYQAVTVRTHHEIKPKLCCIPQKGLCHIHKNAANSNTCPCYDCDLQREIVGQLRSVYDGLKYLARLPGMSKDTFRTCGPCCVSGQIACNVAPVNGYKDCTCATTKQPGFSFFQPCA
jgi:hypothetical protein